MSATPTDVSHDEFQWAYNRYIGDDPVRVASFHEESVKAELARMLYDLRERAGLTREQLADALAVSRDIIEDLEEADYESEHLSTIFRIAGLVGKTLKISLAEREDHARAPSTKEAGQDYPALTDYVGAGR